MAKPDLIKYLSTNSVLQKVLEGKFQPKEVIYTHKILEIDNLIPINLKEEEHTQNNTNQQQKQK